MAENMRKGPKRNTSILLYVQIYKNVCHASTSMQ